MTTISEQIADVLSGDELPFGSALVACGWQAEDRQTWRLVRRDGDALLTETAHRDSWRQYRLAGGAVPKSANHRVLHDNYHLFGPAKLVAQAGGQPICRLDLPDGLAGAASVWPDGELDALDAHVAWAEAVTACATGDYGQNGPASLPDQSVAEELDQAGWSTSWDDGRLHVHVQLPGVYRQLAVEHRAPAGVKLTTNLASLDELDDRCARAMLMLAMEANARLPLVRMAIDDGPEGGALRAEVGFGRALVAGDLLSASLHVLETAVAMTARVLEALRDPELARLVLAAATARDSHSHHLTTTHKETTHVDAK
jgi:hypothetical protein